MVLNKDVEKFLGKVLWKMFTAINRGYAAGEVNLDKKSTTWLDLNRRQCYTSFLTELHKQHFTRYPPIYPIS